MPTCAVKLCRHYSDKCKKDSGITFHMFPRDPVLADRWTKVLRKSRNESWWKPKLDSAIICSVHFSKRDKYFTKSGRQRIKKGAVPTKALFLSSKKSDSEGSDDDTIDSKEEAEKSNDHSDLDISDQYSKNSGYEPGNFSVSSKKRSSKFISIGTQTQETVLSDDMLKRISDSNEYSKDASVSNTATHSNLEGTSTVSSENQDGKPILFVESGTLGSDLDSSDLDSVYDSPMKAKMRKELRRKSKIQIKHTMKLKTLQQANRRLKQRLAKLNKTIKVLKREAYVCSVCNETTEMQDVTD